MTTVAWDGKTLAGDRMRQIGGTPLPGTKVYAIEHLGLLVGGSGSTQFILHAIGRMRTGGWPAGLPESADFTLMRISKGGAIETCDRLGLWTPITRDKWAIGSGADYALGAMAAGATAEEAIRIATDLDINTGLGVDCVSFEGGA